MRDGVAGVFFVSGHTAGFVEKYEVSCGEAAGGRIWWQVWWQEAVVKLKNGAK